MAKKTKGMKIEAELKKLTKLKRKTDEGLGAWVLRLVKASLALDEDVQDEMSDAAYDLCVNVAEAHNKKSTMVDFEGEDIVEEDDDEEDEPEEDDEEEEEEPEPEPVKKSKAKKAKKAKKVKKAPEPEPEEEYASLDEEEFAAEDEDEEEEEPEPVAKAEPKKRETVESPVTGKQSSSHKAYRDLVIANNGLGRKELIALGEEMGTKLPASSRSTVIYHTKETIESLRELLGVEIPEVIKPKKAKKAAKKTASKKVETKAPKAKKKKKRTSVSIG